MVRNNRKTFEESVIANMSTSSQNEKVPPHEILPTPMRQRLEDSNQDSTRNLIIGAAMLASMSFGWRKLTQAHALKSFIKANVKDIRREHYAQKAGYPSIEALDTALLKNKNIVDYTSIVGQLLFGIPAVFLSYSFGKDYYFFAKQKFQEKMKIEQDVNEND